MAKIKFNPAGFEALRQDHRVRADLVARAEKIAGEAGKIGSGTEYKVTDLVLEDPRAAVSVMAATPHAR